MVGKHWEFAGEYVRRAALLAAAGLLLIAGSLKLADVVASQPVSGVLAQFPVALVAVVAIGELAIAISICLWGGYCNVQSASSFCSWERLPLGKSHWALRAAAALAPSTFRRNGRF